MRVTVRMILGLLASGKSQEATLADYPYLKPEDIPQAMQYATWGNAASRKIMDDSRDALDSCDLVGILLDRSQVDDGTAWELGYAYAKDLPSIGIRNDTRYWGEVMPSAKVNAMIAGSMPVCLSRQKLLDWLKNNGK